MGACNAKNSVEFNEKTKKMMAANQAIERKAKMRHGEDLEIRKLLLLGAGESGKSTIFKQMIKLFGKGFGDSQKKNYVGPIHENIIKGIYRLVKAAQADPEVGKIDASLSESINYVEENCSSSSKGLTKEMGEHIALLWADPALKKTFENRAKLQIVESLAYFLDNVKTIADEKFVPSFEDIIRVRVRTTGVLQEEFEMKSVRFRMVDVGGQRNERRKWLHQFDEVSAIIFVSAISEYDQNCFEDESTNRIIESLNLFEELSNSSWFRQTSVILFLNKKDLFEAKFSKVPLKEFFPDFEGETVQDGFKFFEDKFISRSSINKDIFTHITNATDSDNILHVFNALRNIIVKDQLDSGGFF